MLNSKIIFYEENSNFKNILKIINEIPYDFQLITNNTQLNYFFKQNKRNSIMIDELFSPEKKETYEIYEQTNDILKKYNENFDQMHFRNVKIFNTIEPMLREVIALIEKCKKILENKKNTVFLFYGYSFSYFVLNKIALTLNYETDDLFRINKIQGKKLKLINPEKSNITLLIKKKFFRFKHTKFLKNDENNILGLVYKKIQPFKTNKIKCIFFLTSSSEYVLDPIFSLFKKFHRFNTPKIVISFDHQYYSKLNKNDQTDFFDEAYFLAILLEKSLEGKEFLNKINSISRKNNLDFLLLSEYENPLLKKLFFSAAIIMITKKILSEIKPKNIVIANDGTHIGNSVANVSNNLKITSYSIRSLILRPHPIVKTLFKADKICVYGQQGMDVLLKMGYSIDQIINTGNIRYDYINTINQREKKISLFESLKINSNNKLIVVGIGRWYENDEIWMSNLIKFCNKNNFEIIIKVHPIHKTSENFIHQQKVLSIKNSCQKLKYLITFDIEPSDLLPAADLVITDHSNLGIEAALLGKPWLTINFANEDSNFLHTIFDYTGSLFTEKYEYLEKLILEILIEKKHLELFKNSQKKIIENFNYYNDGKSTNRIFELLTNN